MAHNVVDALGLCQEVKAFRLTSRRPAPPARLWVVQSYRERVQFELDMKQERRQADVDGIARAAGLLKQCG